MGPLRGSNGSVAIVVATTGVPEYRSVCGSRRIETVMCRGAATAGARRRSESLQRDGNECPSQRKHQQKSCGQPLHVVYVLPNPRWAQHRTQYWTGAILRCNRSVKPQPRNRDSENNIGPVLRTPRDAHPLSVRAKSKNRFSFRVQARPLILAHHQRTPTKRKRQS